MKLMGSKTSPYVRRIRLLLTETPHEFVHMNIYGEDRDQLRRHSPVLKVPVLIDDGREIYDSRVIARYLSGTLGLEALSWNQENQLSLIDGANDSCVTLLLSKKSGLNIDEDLEFWNLQKERIMATLRTLNAMVEAGEFAQWNYPAICLYCLVDWMDFRDLVDFGEVGSLKTFRDGNRNQPGVADTDPRLA